MVSAGDVIFSILPLAVLIGLLVKRNPWPSSVALPASAALIWLFRLAYFEMDSLLAMAEIFVGFVTALTPLTIVFCAITFFRVLEFTGCLDSIKEFLNNIAPNLLVQTMLVRVCGAGGRGQVSWARGAQPRLPSRISGPAPHGRLTCICRCVAAGPRSRGTSRSSSRASPDLGRPQRSPGPSSSLPAQIPSMQGLVRS